MVRSVKFLIPFLVMIGMTLFGLVLFSWTVNPFKNMEVVYGASDPVIAAAGDIACDPSAINFNFGKGANGACQQQYTSDLLLNAGYTAVLTLGDTQYYCGGYQAFLQSYDLSWGRIKSITHPAVGNHEYLTSGGTDCTSTNAGAAGYFKYFGAAAGNSGQGYYSFDVGTWHIIALNSNCSDAGGCNATSPQGKWLEADLSAHSNFCTLAFWHIPLFSSGGRASANSLTFWQALYNHNADLILTGHDHIYERFAPQTPAGVADPTRGIREFVIGTGGANHTTITTVAANSEIRNANTFGVIKLTLHATSYDWAFVPEAGFIFTDSGTGNCHGSTPDTAPPTAPANLTASNIAWNQISLNWTASTDNIGVAGYRIFRNGSQIATTSTNSFGDPSVQPQTTYNYLVVAFDAAGNTSPSSNTVTVSTPSPPSVLTFTPTDDTYVESDLPTTNFGASTQIVNDNSPVRNILIKFAVSGVLGRNVVSAKLRLYNMDGSAIGGAFHRVSDTTWKEGTVTWNTSPSPDASILSSLGPVAAGTWYEVDVTPLVTGDGTFSLMGISSSADGAYYASKEGAAGFAPQLVVTTSTSTLTATATISPTATLTPTSTATALVNPTATITSLSTATGTASPTATIIPTSSATPIVSPTAIPSPTPTAASTSSPAPTFTPTTSVVFSDGFESGNLSNWTTVQGLVVQDQEVRTGSFAVRETNAGGGATYANKLLPTTQSDLYYNIWFKIVSQGANTVNLMKFRTGSNVSILSVSVNNLGQLSYRNDFAATSVNSPVAVNKGAWQSLQVHLRIAGTASQIEVWYNGALVSSLSQTDNFGTTSIGRVQLGENSPGLTYDIAFDDVSVATGFIAASANQAFALVSSP